MNEIKKYDTQYGLTTQFRFCGNCFRADTYKGCGFACKYCFANNRQRLNSDFDGKVDLEVGETSDFKNLFSKLTDNKDYSSVSVELLRHRVPLHLGGMSDPFQPQEIKYRRTLEFLKLSKEYQYPVIISTKQAFLSKEYFEILDPKIHTFQISLIGTDPVMVGNLERFTPNPKARINFIKQLYDKGFWTGLRIQPLVRLTQAHELIYLLQNHIHYCTIEHLKLPKLNTKCWEDILPNIDPAYKQRLRANKIKPEFELPHNLKLNNINYLKSEFPNVKFGCGDNDLHEYSDSLNCCGVDTMPKAFENWLKYNSMYIKMTGDRSQWIPEKSIAYILMGGSRIKGFKWKDYVEAYYTKLYGKTGGFFDQL